MMKSRLMKSRLMARDGARPRRAKPVKALALASALAGFALAGFGAGAARAEDLFGAMLKSLGINNDAPIEYKERPPLVVPQTHDLPPPQSTRGRDPNWPADPKAGARATRSDQLDNIDRLAVPGKTFRYTKNGPEGLAGGKRVIVASSCVRSHKSQSFPCCKIQKAGAAVPPFTFFALRASRSFKVSFFSFKLFLFPFLAVPVCLPAIVASFFQRITALSVPGGG